jgi:hypothetical protein
MKTYTFNLQYPIDIEAENEKDAREKLAEELEDMDWEEHDSLLNQELWDLVKIE